ncbi:MAG: chemotaxis protein CheD [Candidatus Thiodiazotropha sp.]
MRISTYRGLQRFHIDPGEYHVVRGSGIITTLLGSCVAACLWDEKTSIFGMNHFLLANHRYAKKMPVIVSEAGRYGIHAMELLINNMLKMGAHKSALQAKIFGGANVLYSLFQDRSMYAIGDINNRFIMEFLKKEKIPLIASDLGGNYGRVINFVGSDYSVYLKRINKKESEHKVVVAEKQLLTDQLKEHSAQIDKGSDQITYW